MRQGRKQQTDYAPKGWGRQQRDTGSTALVAPASVLQLAPMALIECVPNVSEGRREAVIGALADALRNTTGVRLLDHSFDASHNRSVFTIVGDATALKAAILALYAVAIEAIDLRRHQGVHPRIGAVDVVPFVPLEDVTMAECVALARDVGAAVAARFRVPVFMYEEAAAEPARRNLAEVRRGEFEGLSERLIQPAWQPDFGPSAPHLSAGASAVGARRPLIAWNINLATDRLDIAREIADTIRHSSGGLRHVKALGVRLAERSLVQVSMNLTNYHETPMFRVMDLVRREAARHGVAILESEIVGLVPAEALIGTAAHSLQLDEASADRVLESRLRH